MERSESLVEFTKALSKFQGEIVSVKKTSVNPYFKSKYADLDAIWDMCRKALSSNGLALIQMPVELGDKLYLESLLIHVSGEYTKGYYPITPMRQTKEHGWILADDPQSVGSAITYGRRYAMSAMLGISADEDDDGEKATARTISGAGLQAPSTQSESGRVLTGVCTISGHNSAKLGKHPTLGWVHKLSDGTFCAGALPQRDVPPETQPTARDEQAEPGADEFPDTPLGEFQRELAKEGMAWPVFEQQVIKMDWPAWVRLNGTLTGARGRWERYKQAAAPKEVSP